MKKLLAVLLALFVVGGFVFAQATVNGYVRVIGTQSDTGFAYADRLRLNLSWTSEDKNVYFFGRLQGSSGGKTTSATFADDTLLDADGNVDADALNDVFTVTGTDIGVSYLYGRVKLFDGMLAITAGKLGNYDYDFGSGVSEYKLGNVANQGYALDSVKGMLFQVLPVEGLNIGLAVFPSGADIAMSDFYFAAKYDIAKIGTVLVQSNLGDDFATSQYSASFSFTGVENLTAIAGYKHEAADTASIYGIFDYTAGDLSFELAPEYFLDASAFYVEGYVSYAKDALTLNVIGAYDTGAGVLDGDYYFGLEVLYKVGKGLLQTGVWYDADAGYSVPLIVKVSF